MAARGVNKVIWLTTGDRTRKCVMPNGQVANLTLATSESWRDKQTGDARNTGSPLLSVRQARGSRRANTCVKASGLEGHCAPATGRTMPESRATFKGRTGRGRTAPTADACGRR